jgi:hypothetical protein
MQLSVLCSCRVLELDQEQVMVQVLESGSVLEEDFLQSAVQLYNRPPERFQMKL